MANHHERSIFKRISRDEPLEPGSLMKSTNDRIRNSGCGSGWGGYATGQGPGAGAAPRGSRGVVEGPSPQGSCRKGPDLGAWVVSQRSDFGSP